MLTLFDVLESHKQNKKDKRKFGLVVQGGGMRGVYSCAALSTLLEYGFSDTFEHVVGASAGAMNGAYFIGEDANAAAIYTEDATNKNFVNLLRCDKKVDVDYCVDMVLKHKHPIDLQKLRDAHAKLHVVVTNAKNGRKEVLSAHKDFLEIYEEFRATSALPILYDKKVKVGDHYYVDGSVSDALPVDVAIELGCTDIVVVLTQQMRNFQFDRRHSRLVRHLVRRLATNQTVAVRRLLLTNERVLKKNLRTILHPLKKVRIYMLEPSDEEILISLGTIDKPKVEAFAKLGALDMDKFLHEPLH